ncbi:BMC domain-containing protein [Lactobacillus sp. 3B(2020)]|uniref:BMC domain-containing protein n=1 Tax=Lactobacillus sp. 3B(2020) TaxID=2695882 RepID=UPI0015DE613C|nr:BMC domain-containing protein [Lactobacillus sp. 3B(2020)]QLL69148.1 BMC domain-containing protein [Lactobacillus sp. 3B(2020)]
MDSLGYVECNGLSGALVAADKMLKTAQVELSSIQNTKGNGWITLQVRGNLSAVSVAVEAVKNDLPNVYVTSVVIGSPSEGLDKLGTTDIFKKTIQEETKEIETPEETPETSVKNVSNSSDYEQIQTEVDSEGADREEKNTQSDSVDETTTDEKQKDESSEKKEVTCNLCGDPNCPRKLGEPHKKCIHYKETN